MFSTRLEDYSPDSDYYHVDPEIKSTEDHQAFFREFVENYFPSIQDKEQTLDEYFSPANLDNINRDQRRDDSYEQASSYVDIYNSDLRKKAYDFSDWIEDALTDYGRDPKRGLIGLFQMGQQMFYERLLGYGLDDLKEFLEDIATDTH